MTVRFPASLMITVFASSSPCVGYMQVTVDNSSISPFALVLIFIAVSQSNLPMYLLVAVYIVGSFPGKLAARS